jgi:hypothetical protein
MDFSAGAASASLWEGMATTLPILHLDAPPTLVRTDLKSLRRRSGSRLVQPIRRGDFEEFFELCPSRAFSSPSWARSDSTTNDQSSLLSARNAVFSLQAAHRRDVGGHSIMVDARTAKSNRPVSQERLASYDG